MPVDSGSPENRVAGAIFELAADLSKHSLGRFVYFAIGLFFFYGGAYGAIQGIEGWPSSFVFGAAFWAFALWGYWRQRREERRERRHPWKLVVTLAGLIFMLGALAFVLLWRRRSTAPLPALTAAEVDRLSRSADS